MRVLNIPNSITFARAAMLVVFWYLIHQGQIEFGLSVFFISWALDAVDGYIARRYNQATEVGSYLDKFIDRISMAVGVIVLIRYGIVPPYALLLFTREYGTLPVIYPVQDKKHSWQGAGILGKITTLGEGVGLLWLALGFPYGVVVVAGVAALGAVTAFSYMRTVFISFVALFFVFSAQAQTGGVIINEVMWDGSEYIELFNSDSQGVSLSGWALTRRESGGVEGTIIVFNGGHSINGGEYFLIEKNEDTTSIPADAIPSSSLTLLQGGELITLYDADGIAVDTAGQLGPWPAGENTDKGTSMERVGDGWQTSVGFVGERNGTPRQVNSVIASTPTPTPVSTPTPTPAATPVPDEEEDEPEVFQTSIVINEFLPNPVGDDAVGEFIELYNPGETDSNISGWQLDDQEGGSKPYTLPAGFSLAAGEYRVVYREDSGLALNNTGDSVRLLDPDEVVQAEVIYESSVPEGHSVNRNNDGEYVQSTTVTPGIKNVLTLPTPKPSSSPKVSSVKGSIATVSSQSGDEKEEEKGDNSTAVKISRVLPNPVGLDGEGEFIELKNTGVTPVNLSGWEIDDAEGGSQSYTIPSGINIASEQTLLFLREETGIALNNTTDSVRLFSPNGTMVDTFTYESVKEGQIFNVLVGGITNQSSSKPSASTGKGTASATSQLRTNFPIVAAADTEAITKTEFADSTNQRQADVVSANKRRDVLRGILLLAAAAMVAIVALDGDQLAREISRLGQSIMPKDRAIRS